ncbi:hypothetical protein [Amycolatopsis sp. GM8]|uniref:hypothetical protein n=1 Tax=Amycolatopsis sp. GM8 TaxID=2896530 RepID=UPI001F334621|nr:hypothetical protein [Amycolatopsis sp. GM8]
MKELGFLMRSIIKSAFLLAGGLAPQPVASSDITMVNDDTVAYPMKDLCAAHGPVCR